MEGFEGFSRLSKEEKEFFDDLVERYQEYGVRQDIEHIIVDHKDGREAHILKVKKISAPDGNGEVSIEAYLRHVLGMDSMSSNN